MRESKYWDDFKRRITETVSAVQLGVIPSVRRVACFVTEKCNFRCEYCNHSFDNNELSKTAFNDIVQKYPDAIIHITGGEPSVVEWLYNYIEETNAIFHLNTNAYITPPKNIQRLKVSLDSHKANEFDKLVNVSGAFDKVVENIKKASKETTTTITCVLSKETYKNTPEFMRWCRLTFPDLYAVFFSVYKGADPRFMFTSKDSDHFFNNVLPQLRNEMDNESLALLSETLDQKKRIMQGVRFPENKTNICYLSMSERVYASNGNMYFCSHLFRDNVHQTGNEKHPNCLYGCNRRLVKFNEEVEKQLWKI